MKVDFLAYLEFVVGVKHDSQELLTGFYLTLQKISDKIDRLNAAQDVVTVLVGGGSTYVNSRRAYG
jgi:hypothetical protein